MLVHLFQMRAVQLKLFILMVHQLKQSSFINQIEICGEEYLHEI